jgi:hypothetical protein
MFDRRLAWTVAGAVMALAIGFGAVTIYLSRTDTPSVRATSTPQRTVTPKPKPGPITIHGTGDVNLDPRQLGLLREGFDAPWSGVRDLFLSDDLSVINLECSPGNGGVEQDKEYRFRCPRGFEAMARNGVDVTNLGNNHSMDFWREPLLSGRDALLKAGLAPVGAGRDAAQAHEPALFERKGRTIAVLGFGGVIPERSWLATANTAGMADGDDIGSMTAAVRAAAERADIVVVTLHWGAERETRPQGGDVDRARAMIAAGADAIFGHHAHVLQPLEFYKGRPIFYGLGNFVWPRGGPTAIAEATFHTDGTVTGCLLPAVISGGRPTLVGEPEC